MPLSSFSSVVSGIERHTIVSRAIKVGRGKASRMIAKTYRVLTVFDKMSNKWFMTGQLPKLWSKLMKEEDKKKYKVRIRMVTEGVLEKFDDVCLDCKDFLSDDIYTCVFGNEIVDVHGKYSFFCVV